MLKKIFKNTRILTAVVTVTLTCFCVKINAMRNSPNENNITINKDKEINELEKLILKKEKQIEKIKDRLKNSKYNSLTKKYEIGNNLYYDSISSKDTYNSENIACKICEEIKKIEEVDEIINKKENFLKECIEKNLIIKKDKYKLQSNLINNCDINLKEQKLKINDYSLVCYLKKILKLKLKTLKEILEPLNKEVENLEHIFSYDNDNIVLNQLKSILIIKNDYLNKLEGNIKNIIEENYKKEEKLKTVEKLISENKKENIKKYVESLIKNTEIAKNFDYIYNKNKDKYNEILDYFKDLKVFSSSVVSKEAKKANDKELLIHKIIGELNNTRIEDVELIEKYQKILNENELLKGLDEKEFVKELNEKYKKRLIVPKENYNLIRLMNIKNNLNITSSILENITNQIDNFNKGIKDKLDKYSLENIADYSYDQIKELIEIKLKIDSIYKDVLINNVELLKYPTKTLIEKFENIFYLVRQNEEFLDFCRKFLGKGFSFDAFDLISIGPKVKRIDEKFQNYLNQIYNPENKNYTLNIDSTIKPYKYYKEYYEKTKNFVIDDFYDECNKFPMRNDIIKNMIRDMSKQYDSDIKIFLQKRLIDNKFLSFLLKKTNAEREILNRLKKATAKENEKINLNEIKSEIKRDIFKEKPIWHIDCLYKEIYKLDVTFLECVNLSEKIKYLREKYVINGSINGFLEHMEEMIKKEEEFFNYYEKVKKILKEIEEKNLSFKTLSKDKQLDFLNLNILEKRIVKLKEIRESFESKLMVEMFYEFYKNILAGIENINKCNDKDFKTQMYKHFNIPKIGLNVFDRCEDFAIKYFNILNISNAYNEKILTIQKSLDNKTEKIMSQKEKKELEIFKKNTDDFKIYFFENLAKKEIELYKNILEYHRQKHMENNFNINDFSSFIKNCKEYVSKIKKIVNLEKNSEEFINMINEFYDFILKVEDVLKETIFKKEENLTRDVENKSNI